MAATFPFFFSRATSSANALLSGAKLYVYDAGTTTPKTVHSNAALSVAHANPVVADSGGQFAPIYLTAGSNYRFTLKTSADVTIQDVDNYSAPLVTAVTLANIGGVVGDNASITAALAAKANASAPTFTGSATATGSFINSTTAAHPGALSSGCYTYYNTTAGASLTGAGSSYDISLINKSGSTALRVPTGTVNVEVAGSLTAVGITNTSPTAGSGYATGAGGAVTQATSKSTGVTLNKTCGQITMHNASLATNTSVAFVVTNSVVAATDTVIANIASAGTAASYLITVDAVAAGQFRIHVRNISGGSLSEALVVNFAILKAVAA